MAISTALNLNIRIKYGSINNPGTSHGDKHLSFHFGGIAIIRMIVSRNGFVRHCVYDVRTFSTSDSSKFPYSVILQY